MHRWPHRACTALCGGALWLVLSGGAIAGPAGTQGNEFIYEVEPGDTLIGLAARFMVSPDDWRLLQTRNHVADPYRLVPGSQIRIPLSRVPVAPATARVVFTRGQVLADGQPLQPGATLTESAHIETGADGAAALELPDGTRVSLPAATSVQVRRLRTFARSGLTDTVIGIDRGAAESRVAPKGGGVGRYEIRTPLMVTGVRGTRYRVAADSAGSRSEVVEGKVGVGAASTTSLAVAAGFGVGVSPSGRLGRPVALLPAPDVAGMPQPVMTASLTAHWRAVPGAVAYRVGVARDAALTEWVSMREVSEPAAVLDDLPDGPSFLVVNAVSPDRLTGHAGVLPFTVKRNPPAPFSLAPAPDGTQHGGKAQFRWAAVPAVSAYELAVAADADFTRQASVQRETGVETQRDLAVGHWWWRLRSLDAHGEPGPWGDALQLSVEPAPPVPVPSDDGRVLRIRWPAMAGGGTAPAGYVVQMASDTAFTADLVTLRTALNEVSVPRPAPGTYYIRVARTAGSAEGAVPPAAAFSAPQRIELPAVLRDAQGGVVMMGGADHGVQAGGR